MHDWPGDAASIVTLAVMAQAMIDGRIDCKTAGRLVVHLQTWSKLLWLHHKAEKTLTTKATKKHEGLPQIYPDERRSNRNEKLPEATRREKTLTTETALTTQRTRRNKFLVWIFLVWKFGLIPVGKRSLTT
jgi:hypothetical protein